MFKALLAYLERRKELRAMLRNEGASVVIADLNLAMTYRSLTRYEIRFLQRLYIERARVCRLRFHRIRELELLHFQQRLTAAQAQELSALRKGGYYAPEYD